MRGWGKLQSLRAQLTATDATNAGDGETPLFYGRKTASGQGARVPPLRGEAGALSGTGDGGGSGNYTKILLNIFFDDF